MQAEIMQPANMCLRAKAKRDIKISPHVDMRLGETLVPPQ
jgi:hypothetical protein